jgi:hypothetical protein
MLLTLQQTLAFVSARRRLLAGIGGMVLLLAVVGPQRLQEACRQYVFDYRADERDHAWQAYVHGIEARYFGVGASSQDKTLKYLGNQRYRVSSYVVSSDFEGRLFFSAIVSTAPAPVYSIYFGRLREPEDDLPWRIESAEIRKTIGASTTVPLPEINIDKLKYRSLEERVRTIVGELDRLPDNARRQEFFKRCMEGGAAGDEVAAKMMEIYNQRGRGSGPASADSVRSWWLDVRSGEEKAMDKAFGVPVPLPPVTAPPPKK